VNDVGVHVPEAHVLRVAEVEVPENRYLVFTPSVGTEIVKVHDGVAEKTCGLPSNAIVEGLAVQPLIEPVPLGAPLAVDIVI